MALESDTLINKLNGGTKSAPIPALVSALLQAFMVQYGTVFRFYANGGRQPPDAPLGRGTVTLGILLFIGATVSFGFTTNSVLVHIGDWKNDYPDTFSGDMAYGLQMLAYVQIIYPVTAAIEFFYMQLASRVGSLGNYKHDEFSPWLSTFKDLAYGTADVTSKGGLCLISFLVATHT